MSSLSVRFSYGQVSALRGLPVIKWCHLARGVQSSTLSMTEVSLTVRQLIIFRLLKDITQKPSVDEKKDFFFDLLDLYSWRSASWNSLPLVAVVSIPVFFTFVRLATVLPILTAAFTFGRITLSPAALIAGTISTISVMRLTELVALLQFKASI